MQLDNVNNSLKHFSKDVNVLLRFPNQELNLEQKKISTSFISKIKGTSKIEKIDANFSIAIKQMKRKAVDYEKGVDAIKKIIVEFIKLRNEIYVEYHNAISDLKVIFGEKVKEIPPELFDFSKVSYLDGNKIFEEVSSCYGAFRVNASICTKEIFDNFNITMNAAVDSSSDNFSDAFSSASKGFFATEKTDKNLAFAEAGFQAFVGSLKCIGAFCGHHLEAHKKITILEREYEEFKSNALSSYAAMTKDAIRISYIHKNIEEFFLPQSRIFYDGFGNVYSKEIDSLTSSIYSSPRAKTLKSQRDELYAELNKKNNEIIIKEYELSKSENEKQRYQEAVKQESPMYLLVKKKKPFFKTSILIFVMLSILCFITFNLSKMYFIVNIVFAIIAIVFFAYTSIKFCEWKKQYGDFCKKHKDKKNYIKKLKKEIFPLEIAVTDLRAGRKQIEQNIRTNVNEMLSTISVDVSIREKVAVHLENIIRLLKTGKMVLESKLDDSMLKPDSQGISDVCKNSLEKTNPSKKLKKVLTETISSVKDGATNRLKAEELKKRKLLAKKFEINNNDDEKRKKQKQEELSKAITSLEKKTKNYQELSTVSLDVFSTISENLIDVFQELYALNEKKIKFDIDKQQYLFEYQNIQNKFDTYFNKLNDDIAELHRVNNKMQSTKKHKVQLDLLTTLCGYTELSQQEIDDFLNGRSNLVI